MGLRKVISESNGVTSIVAIVVLLGAGFVIYRSLLPAPSVLMTTKWMVDLNTLELVAAPVETISPADLDRGEFDYGRMGVAGAVVDAQVYSCGDPTAIEAGMTPEDLEAIDATLAFVMRYDPLSLEMLQNPSEEAATSGAPRRFVSGLAVDEWFPEMSPRGMQLQSNSVPLCDDGRQPLPTRP
ncbi:MAG: hypothetical protein AAGK09_11110 [Planctomycetota bacterium]